MILIIKTVKMYLNTYLQDEAPSDESFVKYFRLHSNELQIWQVFYAVVNYSLYLYTRIL